MINLANNNKNSKHNNKLTYLKYTLKNVKE